MPVAAIFNDDADYRIVPGYCIGCDGDVQSVLLVGETPVEEWDAVALDGESRTSVILAQILLRGPLGRPDLRVFPVDAGTGAFHAQGRTGAVVIGDAARNLPARLTTRVDLGRVWRDWSFARAVCATLESHSFDLVQSHERIACCDVYRAGDGVHFNSAGAKVFAPRLARAILDRVTASVVVEMAAWMAGLPFGLLASR